MSFLGNMSLEIELILLLQWIPVLLHTKALCPGLVEGASELKGCCDCLTFELRFFFKKHNFIFGSA